MISKMSRAVVVLVVLSLACSVAIAVIAMRHTLPPGRLLGISGLAFWILVFVMSRILVVNRKSTPNASVSESDTAPKGGILKFAPTLGKLYLFSGGIAFLLGTMAPRYQISFFVAGGVTCCYGGYLLFFAKKSR